MMGMMGGDPNQAFGQFQQWRNALGGQQAADPTGDFYRKVMGGGPNPFEAMANQQLGEQSKMFGQRLADSGATGGQLAKGTLQQNQGLAAGAAQNRLDALQPALGYLGQQTGQREALNADQQNQGMSQFLNLMGINQQGALGQGDLATRLRIAQMQDATQRMGLANDYSLGQGQLGLGQGRLGLDTQLGMGGLGLNQQQFQFQQEQAPLQRAHEIELAQKTAKANKPSVFSQLMGGVGSIFSDERLKEDIEPFEGGLEIVKAMDPIQYRYNEKAPASLRKQPAISFSAQLVEKVFPDAVKRRRSTSVKDARSLDIVALQAVQVNALKELDERLSKLEGEE